VKELLAVEKIWQTQTTPNDPPTSFAYTISYRDTASARFSNG